MLHLDQGSFGPLPTDRRAVPAGLASVVGFICAIRTIALAVIDKILGQQPTGELSVSKKYSCLQHLRTIPSIG